MPKRYSIAEARSNLPTIVDQAEAGQAIELTRRGKPVAVVVSLREMERLRGDRSHFGEAYRRFLKTHALREVGLDGEHFESTRDRGPGPEGLFVQNSSPAQPERHRVRFPGPGRPSELRSDLGEDSGAAAVSRCAGSPLDRLAIATPRVSHPGQIAHPRRWLAAR